MKYKIKIMWYHIEVMWTKILRMFNIRYSTEPIPSDTLYCYEHDDERNKKEPCSDGGYWIKPCKYYRSMNGHNAACTYVGFIGFDLLLGDQCKMCGVKEADYNEIFT